MDEIKIPENTEVAKIPENTEVAKIPENTKTPEIIETHKAPKNKDELIYKNVLSKLSQKIKEELEIIQKKNKDAVFNLDLLDIMQYYQIFIKAHTLMHLYSQILKYLIIKNEAYFNNFVIICDINTEKEFFDFDIKIPKNIDDIYNLCVLYPEMSVELDEVITELYNSDSVVLKDLMFLSNIKQNLFFEVFSEMEFDEIQMSQFLDIKNSVLKFELLINNIATKLL